MSPVTLVHGAPTVDGRRSCRSVSGSDPPSWTAGMVMVPTKIQVGQEGGPMLQTGDLVPHFTADETFSGESFDYSDIWQRKNLVLVLLPHADSAASTKVDQLTARMSELTGDDSACVITRDSVSGVSSPGVIVADRWGEIHHVAEATTVDDIPGPDDLIEWLRTCSISAQL